MALVFNDNFQINAGKPIDSRFGPYTSINEANLAIPLSRRFNGLLIGIYDDPLDIPNSDIIYYYYYGSFTDLEIKPLLGEENEEILVPDGLTKIGTYDQDINDIDVNPDWIWRINGSLYEKLTITPFTITPSIINFTRIDLIYGTNTGSVEIIQGTPAQDPDVAIPPNLPPNSVGFFLVFVNNSGITSFINFALSSFVRFDINNQNLSPIQRLNARTNIQALSKDTNDTRFGTLTQNGAMTVNGSFTQTGRPFTINFINDTASANGFVIKNTVTTNPGGLFMQERGSTIIRARGDSVTNYYILKLQGSNALDRVVVDNNGIYALQRSIDSQFLTRRDELYLNYTQTSTESGVVNNLPLSASTKLLIVSNAEEITGLVGEETREVIIYANGNELIIKNESIFSLESNRFSIEQDIVIPDGKYEKFIKVNNKWRIRRFEDGGVILSETGVIISFSYNVINSTSGNVTANWISTVGIERSVISQPISFAGTPSSGENRWDLIKLNDNGTVSVITGIQDIIPVRPLEGVNGIIGADIIWDDLGEFIIAEPPITFPNRRYGTKVTYNNLNNFARIISGPLINGQLYALQISYTNYSDDWIVSAKGGTGILNVTFLAGETAGTPTIKTDSVQIETVDGNSEPGDWSLIDVGTGIFEIYHKSKAFWGRTQFRILFMNEIVNQAWFINNDTYISEIPLISNQFDSTPVSLFTDYEQSSGNISFAPLKGKPRKYGFSTPLTGNIVFTTIGALETIKPKIKWNGGVLPTLSVSGGGVTLIREIGNFITGVDNYVYPVCHKDNSGVVTSINYEVRQSL